VALFTRHPQVLQSSFSELKRMAQEQPLVLTGTPGSVGVREVKGRRFYYRQFYDAQGKKGAEYIGPVGAPEAEEKAEAVRGAISLAHSLVKEGRLLGQAGYVRADRRAVAVLGALANHALFAAGAVLVGSHAYGALLNELGVRAASLSTEDVDIVRGRRLDAALLQRADFEGMLADSTVVLVPVPGFGKAPPTSYKAPGSDRFRVDLLVPSGEDVVGIKPVPELNAHAQAMPHMRHLLVRPIDAIMVGREAVVSVRVPRPEALAWHKVLLSQLRTATLDKRNKDRAQAAVLLAVLAEDAPAALKEAMEALPAAARGLTRKAVLPVVRLLEQAGHVRAAEWVHEIV
jgi:hypothetical protein